MYPSEQPSRATTHGPIRIDRKVSNVATRRTPAGKSIGEGQDIGPDTAPEQDTAPKQDTAPEQDTVTEFPEVDNGRALTMRQRKVLEVMTVA